MGQRSSFWGNFSMTQRMHGAIGLKHSLNDYPAISMPDSLRPICLLLRFCRCACRCKIGHTLLCFVVKLHISSEVCKIRYILLYGMKMQSLVSVERECIMWMAYSLLTED